MHSMPSADVNSSQLRLYSVTLSVLPLPMLVSFSWLFKRVEWGERWVLSVLLKHTHTWYYISRSHQSRAVYYLLLRCILCAGPIYEWTPLHEEQKTIENLLKRLVSAHFCGIFSTESAKWFFLIVDVIIYLHREKKSTQIKVKMANGCPLRSWRTAWLIFCGAALTSNLLLFYDFVQAFECWRSTESRFSCETQYIARCLLLFRRYPNSQR